MYIPTVLLRFGFNRRALTYTDFEALCHHENINVLALPMRTHGIYTVVRNRSCIGLSDRLRGLDLTYAAFHELAHFYYHHPATNLFGHPNESKTEFQAHAIAICAVLPLTEFSSSDFDEMPASFIALRFQVWRKWNL